MIVLNENVKLEELKKLHPKRPKYAGSHWCGIPHYDLVSMIIEGCEKRGWKVLKVSLSLSKDKADLAGALQLEIPNLKAPEGQTFCIGFIHSNMMRRRLKMTIGTNVLVCNNGLVTGEIILSRKHTLRFDLLQDIDTALNEYLKRARDVGKLVKRLKKREIDEAEVAAVVMATGTQSIMPWSRIGKVVDEYLEPQHEEFKPRTAWSLINAFTNVVKMSPPLTQMSQISRFKEMLCKLLRIK